MNLIKQQNRLQEQAQIILKELNLLEFLSDIGEPMIVGSMALGLMVWPDIDIDLGVNEIKDEDYFKVVQYLFKNPKVKRLILSDNRTLSDDLKARGIPESIYLGVFIEYENILWKMDIRFLPISAIRTKKHIEEIKEKLTEEKREIILDIKNQLFSHPKYVNKELSSMDIYKAVLEDNVKNIEEFKDYFHKKSGINL